ncbi:MAG: hypothetical protein K9G30_06485 [Parvibaculum sp.]|nr:hypothetical protein [Parvibaculum sp.]
MANYESSEGSHTTIVLERRENTGLLAGILGCIAGLLGIFSIGVLFVPIAMVCGLIGLMRGISGNNAAGIGTSVLAGFLGIFGFFASPSLWLIVGAMFFASGNSGHTSHSHSAAYEASQQRAVNTRRSIAGINTLISTLEHFGAVAADYKTRTASVEKKYRLISSKMRKYETKARSLPSTASVEKGQIIVSLSQGSFATDDLHWSVEQAKANFQSKAANLETLTSQAWIICKQPHQISQNTGPDNLGTACSRFSEVYGPYEQHRSEIVRGFEALEATYRQTKKIQGDILNSVDEYN